jgi:hypothetical protein
LENFHLDLGDLVPVNSKKCDAGTRQRPTGKRLPSDRKLTTGAPLGFAGGKPQRNTANSFVPSGWAARVGGRDAAAVSFAPDHGATASISAQCAQTKRSAFKTHIL